MIKGIRQAMLLLIDAVPMQIPVATTPPITDHQSSQNRSTRKTYPSICASARS
jgi:hypothetical protein